MDEPKSRKPGSLLKRAFFNQYNYILLGSASLYALATQSFLPLVVGLGAETLWLVLGADTKFFHRWVDKQEDREERERRAKETAELLRNLDEGYAERFGTLQGVAAEIASLAKENQGIEAMLIREEMAKLGEL